MNSQEVGGSMRQEGKIKVLQMKQEGAPSLKEPLMQYVVKLH